jgi:hypothetical protein
MNFTPFTPKKTPKFLCESCHYSTSNSKDFDRHKLTRKHRAQCHGMEWNEFYANALKTYICKDCDFQSSKCSDYTRHLKSKKHANNINVMDNNKYTCPNCNNGYSSKFNLNKHQKKCNNPKMITDENSVLTNELVLELLKQNKDFQNTVIEQNNKIIELSNKPTYNTINNNQFNLNVYLNETCKDAMNIVDFVNSLKLTIEDFETTGRLGFVDGISRIIIKELKNLDTEKMPIHCTDYKRETVYIKDNDKWEKENDEKRRFKWAINRVAQLNLNQIQNWQLAYPESVVNNTPANEKFTELALVALGGRGEEQENKFREKIMKNVLKEVVLDKKSMVK